MAVALLALAWPGSLHAHGALRSSSPAAGARLAAPPAELRLTFSEAPELAETTVSLVAAAGRVLRLGRLTAVGSKTVVARIAETLAPGEYRVVWRIVGADGHPTRGEYRFTVQAKAGSPTAGALSNPGAAAPPAGIPGAVDHAGADRGTPGSARAADHLSTGHLPGHDTGMEASAPPFVAIRFLLYVGLIGVLGAIAFRLLVLGRLASRRRAPALAALEARAEAAAARIGSLAAGALVLVEVARLIAQSAALNGGGAALDLTGLRTLLGHTHWGATWLFQVAATVAALVAFRLARRGRHDGWLLAAVAGVGLAVATALGGHARVSALPALAVTADALHLTGAAGWLGSLAATMAAGVVVALRGPAHERAPAVAALVDAFSPTALIFASLTAATGFLAAWLQIGHLPALTGTAYGRVFLLKMGLVAGVGLVGAYNWLRVRPALGTDAGSARLRRSATMELSVGVLVVLVTAILVGLPTPVGM